MGISEMGGSKRKKEKKGKWTEAVDPNTGKTYYYNKDTGQSVWEIPEDPTISSSLTEAKAAAEAEAAKAAAEAATKRLQAAMKLAKIGKDVRTKREAEAAKAAAEAEAAKAAAEAATKRLQAAMKLVKIGKDVR